MEYNHLEIEKRWQQRWQEEGVYTVREDVTRPKFYVLDMFPYPSGAGLHVGHPLGYIASDIIARYKRQCGFNVLHPMGFDAYGLPAEQYAIQTGQHPEVTTETNIRRYKEQLGLIGLGYDWSREVRTCDPAYYKWTQWAFMQMFRSWYDTQIQKARPISELEAYFTQHGTEGLSAAASDNLSFTAAEWMSMDTRRRSEVLMNYRLAFQAETMVNWCAELGTVLANDEVSEGLSVRGGYPVEQKKMRQWCLRVSAYAQRLLDGLDSLEWSDSLKETQRNWIGRSEGAEMLFDIAGRDDLQLEIFTTRADTVFGVTFMVLAPESEYVHKITTPEQKEAVDAYLHEVSHKTERERQIDKKVSGVFTGAYAVNPMTDKQIPVWVSDYVLAGYGTGAIMAVPAHDSRDYAFARHFDLPIIPLIEGADVSEESFDAKEGVMINSCGPELNLNGMQVKEAIARAKEFIAEKGIGRVKVNYRLRDAIFSRQRYWGEPFPVCYHDSIPELLPDSCLPLELPAVDSYLPTADGEPPLARAKDWNYDGMPLEVCTMPGFAGSSAYYLRYMDPHNDNALVSPEANAYWRNVDLYVGGTEHATGHLIYSRFWNKFLYDLGLVVESEPFHKLVNQGMIQGRSNFAYRIKGTNKFVSKGLRKQYDTTPIRVDISLTDNDILDTERFRAWRPDFADAEFVLEDGKYVCGYAVEKMSKSMFNVVNPDDIVERYGADTLRLYEMFLGPLQQSKPWDTNGIDGVSRFLKKLWSMMEQSLKAEDKEPLETELRTIHKLIRKVTDDIENFSFNTSVAAFMIALNELQKQKSANRRIMELFVRVLAPFAPHIAEEYWHMSGHEGTIADAAWPKANEQYLKAESVRYAISFNGKTRFTLDLPADMDRAEVEKRALAAPEAAKWCDGKTPRKIIVVPGKIVNIVL